jgi:rod shape determining protein RodA
MKSRTPAEQHPSGSRRLFGLLHLDLPLFLGLLTICGIGLAVLFSAGGEDLQLLARQVLRLGLAFAVLLVLAQIPPHQMRLWTPWIFAVGIGLLLAVLVIGEVGKGAQRWLDLGLFRFQPSELLKLAVPMMLAWYLEGQPLPPHWTRLLLASVLILVPTLLIAKQPDLGTSLLIASSGLLVLFLAGLRWKLIAWFLLLAIPAAAALWNFGMRDYQKQRVLTFLNPESDPLGSGYHIIQSKIAIGSGGLFGKGWGHGTQSHLDFLPERSTDFIFAVLGEEFGLMGALTLLVAYGFLVGRGLWIAALAQDTYTRLLAGSLSLTFFVYVFVNIGMVSGLLPVVGVPLPLISYGGTSVVTLMAGFGILMSIHTHRKLMPK